MKQIVLLSALLVSGLLLGHWLTMGPGPSDLDGPSISERESAGRTSSAARLHGRGNRRPASEGQALATFRLEGLVVDEDGEPVADVRILCEYRAERALDDHWALAYFAWAESGSEPYESIAETRTDAAGRFAVTGLVPRLDYRCRLEPSPPHVAQNRSIYRASVETLKMRFELHRGEGLRGQVVDERGMGVAALVSAHGWEKDGQPTWLPQMATDADGRFEFHAVPDGQAYFTVSVPGRCSRQGIAVRTPTDDVVVLQTRLADGGAVSGRVMSTAAVGIPGARVLARVTHRNPGEEITTMALDVTDANGRYFIGGLDTGRLDGIDIDAPGHALQTGLYRGFPVRSNEVFTAHVLLARGATIRGRVLDEAGEPVPGALVQCDVRRSGRGARHQGESRRVSADHAGQFAFEGLFPLGVVRLRAFAPGAATLPPESGAPSTTFQLLEEGQIVERDLRLTTSTAVEGRVVDATGAPVVGARVHALSPEARSRAQEGLAAPVAVSDPEGRFALRGLYPEERWTLTAKTESLQSAPLVALRVPRPPDRPPEVELILREGGAIRGRVVTPDEEGLAERRIQLRALPRDGVPAENRSTDTDTQGYFLFEGLPAGRYSLLRDPLAEDPGDAKRLEFDLEWGEVIRDVRLLRTPLLEIRGVVVDQIGSPAPQAVVMYQRMGSDAALSRSSVSVEPDGGFVLQVPPGTYSVWTRGGETLPPVEAGTRGLRLETVVVPPREIFGTVIDPDGNTVFRAQVTIWTKSAGGGMSGQGTTCTMGRFHAAVTTEATHVDVVVHAPEGAAGRPLNAQPAVVPDVPLDGREVRVRLERGRIAVGRVRTESGSGIAGVVIECQPDDGVRGGLGNYARHTARTEVTTNADGQFAVLGLLPEPHRLQVRPRPCPGSNRVRSS